jgi:hypothetical protein
MVVPEIRRQSPIQTIQMSEPEIEFLTELEAVPFHEGELQLVAKLRMHQVIRPLMANFDIKELRKALVWHLSEKLKEYAHNLKS